LLCTAQQRIDPRTLGLFADDDGAALETVLAAMQAIVASLPLADWMTVQIMPLTAHPGARRSPATRDRHC